MGADVASSVSRTARYMALFRALETARSKERLFEDPFAIDFLPFRMRAAVRLARLSMIGGLVERAIDVTEVYTTDGEIAQYDLLVLTDDRDFFPAYEAVWLYRADLGARHPAVVEQLRRLDGRIRDAHIDRKGVSGCSRRRRLVVPGAMGGMRV